MTHNTLDLGHLEGPPYYDVTGKRDELADVTAERDDLRRQVRFYQDALQLISADSCPRKGARRMSAQDYATAVLTGPVAEVPR